MEKRIQSPFLKEGNLGITKNYKDITFNVIAAKIYNALLVNLIRAEVKKINPT